MRHRLRWFIHLRARGLRNGVEQPAYTAHGTFYLHRYAAYGEIPTVTYEYVTKYDIILHYT